MKRQRANVQDECVLEGGEDIILSESQDYRSEQEKWPHAAAASSKSC